MWVCGVCYTSARFISKIMKNTFNTSNAFASAYSFWGYVIGFLLSTSNRLYIGWFGILMFPLISLAAIAYISAFIFAPPVDIDGIREPVAGALLYGNNIISGAIIPSSNAIGVHFYPVWEALGVSTMAFNLNGLNFNH